MMSFSREPCSSVWKYFTRSTVANEIVCKLCEGKPCRNCKKDFPCKLKGMNATNAKKHLKFVHPNEFEETEKSDRKVNKDHVQSLSHKRKFTDEPSSSTAAVPPPPAKEFFKPRALSLST